NSWQSIIKQPKRGAMPIVHFRGVAVVVGDKGSLRATEILFPQTDGQPRDGKTRPVDTQAEPAQSINVFTHADKPFARRHYAGALIIGADGSTSYRRFTNRRVDVQDGSGEGALMPTPSTPDAPLLPIPPLDDIIIDPDNPGNPKNKKLPLIDDR